MLQEQHSRRIALGQDEPAEPKPPPPFVLVQCPECSYYDHELGGCVVCEDGDPGAECLNCVGGKPDPGPWYKRSEIVVPIAISVMTTVLGAVATYYVMKKVR